LANLKPGAKFEGIVTRVMIFGAFVDIGFDYEGLVPISKLQDGPTERVEDVVQEGDGVTVWVVALDTENNKLTLSMSERKRFPAGAARETQCDLALFKDVPADMWLEGKVMGTAKFGAFVKVSPPGSELSAQGLVLLGEIRDGFVEDITSEVEIGQTVKVRIVNVDVDAKRLGLSMKAEELPPADLESFVDLPSDTWLDGTIANTAAFGAFVKVSPPNSKSVAQGLVPLREVKDGFVSDINEEVSAGQEVKVRVVSVDTENNKLTLSMKTQAGGGNKNDLSGFENIADSEWLVGTVVSLQNYGAFVEVANPGGAGSAQGLLHISQIQEEPLEDPGEVLEEEMEVNVRVINVDTEAGKLSLSMREK